MAAKAGAAGDSGAGDVRAGRLVIPIVGNLDTLAADLKRGEKEARTSGEKMGAALGDGFEKGAAKGGRDALGRFLPRDGGRAAGSAGERAGEAFDRGFQRRSDPDRLARRWLQGLEEQFRRDEGRVAEMVARGLLSPEKAAEAGRRNAEAYNDALTRGIDKLRGKGIGRTALADLQNSFKDTGGGSADGFFGAFRVRALALVAFLGLSIAGAFQRAFAFGADSVRVFKEFEQSFARLNGTAKLYNLSQRDLLDNSAKLRRELSLSVTDANNLTAQATKLAARAGEVSSSYNLMAAALDLGAAQGLNATRVATALEQTLRGLDEGTDALLQKNPSEIYDEFAATMGRTGESLSDAEQKQALFNAIMTAGATVAGEYEARMATATGELERQRQKTDETKAALGDRLVPILASAAAAFNDVLGPAVDGFIRLLDRMAGATANNIRLLRQLGAERAELAPLEMRQARTQAEESLGDLRQKEIELRQRLGQTRARATTWRDQLNPFSAVNRGVIESEVDPNRAESRSQLAARAQALRDRAGALSTSETQTLATLEALLVNLDSQRVATETITEVGRELPSAEEAAERARTIRQAEDRLREADRQLNEALGANGNVAQAQTNRDRAAERVRALGGAVPGEPDPNAAATPAAPETPAARRARLAAERRAAVAARRAARAEETAENAAERQAEREESMTERVRSASAGVGTTLSASLRASYDKMVEDAHDVFGDRIPEEVQAGLDRIGQNVAGHEALESMTVQAQEVHDALANVYDDEAMAAADRYVDDLIAVWETLDKDSDAAKAFEAEIARTAAAYEAAVNKREQSAAELERSERRRAEDEKRRHKEAVDRQRERIELIAQTAQAMIGAGQEFGIVSEQTAKNLQGIVELAANAARISQGDMTAIPGAIKNVADLATGLFGGNKEWKQALKDNEEELRRLRVELANFRFTQENASRAQEAVAILLRNAGEINNRGGGFLGKPTGDRQREYIEALLRETGLTYDQLLALAQEKGIQLLDSHGRIITSALEQFAEAMRLASAAMVGFADTAEGMRERQSLENDVFDREETPAQRLTDELAILAEHNAALFEQFGLANVDTSTAEGRAQLEAAIRAIMEAFASGTLNLGQMTREEFLTWMRGVESALDEAAENGGATADGTPETRLGVSITEVQADRLLSFSATMVYHLAGIHDLMSRGAGATPIPSAPVFLPAGPTDTGGSSVTVMVDRVEVSVGAPAGPDPVGFGRDVGAGVREGLIGQARIAARAQGRTDFRINVE